MDPWVSSILALLGIPAFIGSIVSMLSTRRKFNAETEKLQAEKAKLESDVHADAVRIVTESAATLLGPLNVQLKQTQKELGVANDKVRMLGQRVDELVQKVDDANAREDAQRSRADAAEAHNRLLQRQLAQATRIPRSPKETDR